MSEVHPDLMERIGHWSLGMNISTLGKRTKKIFLNRDEIRNRKLIRWTKRRERRKPVGRTELTIEQIEETVKHHIEDLGEIGRDYNLFLDNCQRFANDILFQIQPPEYFLVHESPEILNKRRDLLGYKYRWLLAMTRPPKESNQTGVYTAAESNRTHSSRKKMMLLCPYDPDTFFRGLYPDLPKALVEAYINCNWDQRLPKLEESVRSNQDDSQRVDDEDPYQAVFNIQNIQKMFPVVKFDRTPDDSDTPPSTSAVGIPPPNSAGSTSPTSAGKIPATVTHGQFITPRVDAQQSPANFPSTSSQ